MTDTKDQREDAYPVFQVGDRVVVVRHYWRRLIGRSGVIKDKNIVLTAETSTSYLVRLDHDYSIHKLLGKDLRLKTLDNSTSKQGSDHHEH
jgi:hypothetical protein